MCHISEHVYYITLWRHIYISEHVYYITLWRHISHTYVYYITLWRHISHTCILYHISHTCIPHSYVIYHAYLYHIMHACISYHALHLHATNVRAVEWAKVTGECDQIHEVDRLASINHWWVASRVKWEDHSCINYELESSLMSRDWIICTYHLYVQYRWYRLAESIIDDEIMS